MDVDHSAAVSQLRERLSDVIKPHHETYGLHKWLKVNEYDVEKAETQFRNSVAYKEKLKVDQMLQKYRPPEVLSRYLTGGICGYDREGSPVRVELFGLLDMKGIMQSVRKSDLEKVRMYQCEKTLKIWEEQSRKLGKPVDGLTVIFDMSHVGTKSLWQPGLQMYLHLVKVMEDNYPDLMKRMFIVNAPSIFPLLWKICRPWMSEDCRNKIYVLGSNFHDTLIQYIEPSQFPQYLGGVMKDPDGNVHCVTKLCQGGYVPSTYYLTEEADWEHMKTVTIVKGEQMRLDFKVTKPGAILSWEFRTDDCDIGFGVVRLVDYNKEEVVLPMKKYNCHLVTEDDSMVCQEPGTYVLVFDNTDSWVRCKDLQYCAGLDEVPEGGDFRKCPSTEALDEQ